jgi:hypothetical protein
LKALINNFISQNEAVIEFLENIATNYKEADQVIPQYNDFLARSKFNVALGPDYANILQLSNDEEIYGQFDVEDISRLFESLLKIQKYNLSTIKDAANFEYSVMDDPIRAREIAETGIHLAQEMIEELQKLLHQMSR